MWGRTPPWPRPAKPGLGADAGRPSSGKSQEETEAHRRTNTCHGLRDPGRRGERPGPRLRQLRRPEMP